MAYDPLSLDPSKPQPLVPPQNISIISDETQRILNEPAKAPEGLDDQDQLFLKILMGKIDNGDINLYQPSTLFNMPVYEGLTEEAQGKADFNAVNLLTSIREIRKLWQNGQQDTYQIQNLVHQIRMTKERLEAITGDIFII